MLRREPSVPIWLRRLQAAVASLAAGIGCWYVVNYGDTEVYGDLLDEPEAALVTLTCVFWATILPPASIEIAYRIYNF